jgi:hypothetical protein
MNAHLEMMVADLEDAAIAEALKVIDMILTRRLEIARAQIAAGREGMYYPGELVDVRATLRALDDALGTGVLDIHEVTEATSC